MVRRTVMLEPATSLAVSVLKTLPRGSAWIGQQVVAHTVPGLVIVLLVQRANLTRNEEAPVHSEDCERILKRLSTCRHLRQQL